MNSLGARDKQSQPKRGQLGKAGLDVVTALNESEAMATLGNAFERIFKDVLAELDFFPSELTLDYHLVFFDKSRSYRYSVIEAKRLTPCAKEYSFGVVGALVAKNRDKYKNVFLQFGTGNFKPIGYFKDEGTGEPVPIKDKDELEELFGQTAWRKKKGDFAIAATLIEKDGGPIGAFTVDYSASEYPTFSFRAQEVQIVFTRINLVKTVIESQISGSFHKAINEAMAIITE